jgi:hypothetical protein
MSVRRVCGPIYDDDAVARSDDPCRSRGSQGDLDQGVDSLFGWGDGDDWLGRAVMGNEASRAPGHITFGIDKVLPSATHLPDVFIGLLPVVDHPV